MTSAGDSMSMRRTAPSASWVMYCHLSTVMAKRARRRADHRTRMRKLKNFELEGD